MKFTVKVADFREACAMASHTIDKTKNASCTKKLLIQAIKEGGDRVRLFSTDLNAFAMLRVEGTVAEAGDILVDPKELAKTLPNLDENAAIELTLKASKDEKGNLDYKSGKLQAKCASFKPKFGVDDPRPMLAYVDQLPMKLKADLDIPAWKLREVFERTLTFSTDTDNLAQAFLRNLHLRTRASGLEAFSTNGNVLAKGRVDGVEVDEAKAFTLDIPKKAIPALQKILSNQRFKATEDNAPRIRLAIEKRKDGTPNRMLVRTDEIYYGMALASERIPARAFDSEEAMAKAVVATVQFNREGLIAAARRCEPFLPVYEKGAKGLRMTLKDNVATFYDADGDELDKVAGTGEGDGEAAGTIDVNYLFGILNASKEEILTARFTSKSAVLFGSGAEAQGRSFYLVGCMQEKVPAKPMAKAETAEAPAQKAA
jgi:hypothetical protein